MFWKAQKFCLPKKEIYILIYGCTQERNPEWDCLKFWIKMFRLLIFINKKHVDGQNAQA